MTSKYLGGTYEFVDKLGQGSQASVYKAVFRTNDHRDRSVFAIKETPLTYLLNCDEKKFSKRWNNLVNELTLLQKLNSPYITKVYELIQASKNIYLVQEFVNGGSLQNLLELKGRFPEKIAKRFLAQIVQGCTALYAERVVHRDLKLDNILVHFHRFSDKVKTKDIKAMDLATEEFTIKICDLGFSRKID